MSRSPLTNYQILDATGKPVSGGVLYTYVAGTTTLKATYSDEARTTPNANPIVADAAGILGPVYMTPGEPYKFVEKRSVLGTTLRTTDNVYSVMLTSDTQATRIKQIASNPLDYGALGDGVADERADVAAAITASTGVVDLLGLVFRCDLGLNLKSGLTLRNGTLDFSACTASDALTCTGSLGTPTALTADANFGAAYASATSVSGLSAGDLMALYDSGTYVDPITRGEIAEISSIDTLDVYLDRPVMDVYETAQAAKLAKITPVEDVLFEDLTIIGQGAVSGDRNLVSLLNCRRIRFVRCRFVDIDNYAIRMGGCYDVKLEDCTFSNGVYGVVAGMANTGIRVENCHFSDIGYPIATINTDAWSGSPLGVTRHVQVKGNTIQGASATSECVYLSSSTQHIVVEGNTIRRDSPTLSSLIYCAGLDCVIRDNDLRGQSSGSTRRGIRLAPTVPLNTGRNYSLVVRENRINTDGEHVSYVGGYVVGGSGTLNNLEIIDNHCTGGSSSSSVTITPGPPSDEAAPITTCTIAGNRCDGSLSVTINDTTGVAAIATLNAYGNRAASIAFTGEATARAIAQTTLEDNKISGAVSVTYCPVVRVIGGRTVGAETYTDVQSLDLDGHTVEGGCTVNNASYEGEVLLTGGRYSGGTRALYHNATDATGSGIVANGVTFGGTSSETVKVYGVINHGLFSGCYFVNDDGNDCLALEGAAAGNMANVVVHNNLFQDGLAGIDLDNGSNVSQFANRFVSCVTNFTGDFSSHAFVLSHDTPPTEEGTVYVDPDSHQFKVHDGTAWRQCKNLSCFLIDGTDETIPNGSELTFSSSYTLPAGTLAVGSVIDTYAFFQAVSSAQPVTVRVYAQGLLVAESMLIGAGEDFFVRVRSVVTVSGASGSLLSVSEGDDRLMSAVMAASNRISGASFLAGTFDTTADAAITVTAEATGGTTTGELTFLAVTVSN